MSAKTKIEWCDSTFNPVIGCTKISPACDRCYAEVSTPARAMKITWGAGQARHRTAPSTWAQPIAWDKAHDKFFAVHGRRRRVFCASLADVFDNQWDPQWRADLFELIEKTPNLDWLLLTKRIGNVGNMLPVPFDFDRLYPNVWLGATVVNQEEGDRDIPKLLTTPARVRFLSCEPLLGPLSLTHYLRENNWRADGSVTTRGIVPGTKLDWVIAGGESGPGARPSHPDWYRSLRDQCAAAGVPFLFKQWGEWAPSFLQANLHRGPTFDPLEGDDGMAGSVLNNAGGHEFIWPVVKRGKKAAGRLLDGIEHNGFPS